MHGTGHNMPLNKRFQDLSGVRIGRLTVASYAGHKRAPSGHVLHYWACACDCGTHKAVLNKHLTRARPQLSCGCLRSERTAQANTKHSMSGSPEYRSWQKMIARCYNPKCDKFHLYGGRGITVCDEWRRDFAYFFSHIGPRPPGRYSVDRIDNDKGYEPGNVRWATQKQQNSNQRRTRTVMVDGTRMLLSEYCKLVGISINTVRYRINNLGWPAERATEVRDARRK